MEPAGIFVTIPESSITRQTILQRNMDLSWCCKYQILGCGIGTAFAGALGSRKEKTKKLMVNPQNLAGPLPGKMWRNSSDPASDSNAGRISARGSHHTRLRVIERSVGKGLFDGSW